MSVEIRAARLDDAPEILSFYRTLVEEQLPYIMNTPPPSIQQQRAFVSKFLQRQQPFYVAEYQGRIIGMATGRATDSQRMAFSFSVCKKHRRQGLGQQLYLEVEKRAIELGFCEIYALVGKHNPSLPFYQGNGFTAGSSTRSFTSHSGKKLMALTFRKTLP